MARGRVTIAGPAAPADLVLLLARIVTGAFLIWGVMDNVLNPARMAEFVKFLGAQGFPAPRLMAPLSVYTQLAAGVCIALGFGTRWAAWLLVANMIVALVTVDAPNGIRPAWPAASLVLLGLIFAAIGPGRHALDRR